MDYKVHQFWGILGNSCWWKVRALVIVRPYGAWDRGRGLGWVALSGEVFDSWLARGGILRVAQNDKGYDRVGYDRGI
jgi:hypothetical protein